MTPMLTAGESVRELWRYRELFYFMVWRDIKIRYKQSVLGALWAVLQPFAMMLIFTVLFNRMARIDPGEGIPYSLFSYSGLVAWTYFSQAVTQSGMSLVNNRQLLTKVYFPRVTIPAASSTRGLLDFAVASVMLAGLMAYHSFSASSSYHFVLDWELFLWPVMVIPLVLLAMGMGMFFAAANVRYRDVQYILPFLMQIWMFLSPIIYPTEKIPERFRFLMFLNPVAGILDGMRACIFPTKAIDFGALGVSCALTAVIFVGGVLYFRKTARNFADIV